MTGPRPHDAEDLMQPLIDSVEKARRDRERLSSPTGRHNRNAHLLELSETDWRCLICGHYFDAASDADLFACGDDCTGKHPGDRPVGSDV